MNIIKGSSARAGAKVKDGIRIARNDVRRRMRRPLTSGRVLKWLRVAVSMLMLTGMTLMFVAAEGWVARWLGWMPKMQIMGLAMSGAVTLLLSWFVLTGIFGRLYCSWFCPMGALQDLFIRAARLTKKLRRKHAFRYAGARNRTRYAVVVAVVASMVMGISFLATLFDPYSNYGRIAGEIWLPVKQWIAREPVIVASWLAFGIAAAVLAAVGIVAMSHGRLVCNTVCPVGGTLGLFSRFSLFHFDIDTDLCVNCHKCERACKAQCIDTADHVVDGSRCVACFNCVAVCGEGAIRYTTRRKRLVLPLMQRVEGPAPEKVMEKPAAEGGTTDRKAASDKGGGEMMKIDRRQFLATGMIVAATPALLAARKKGRRIAALTYGGKSPEPTRYVAPPGRRNMASFLEKCTGCGLCIARCPAKVLKPSANQFGWLHALHPVMDYGKSYCRYNCVRCTEVCPTGALVPLEEEEKHIFIIGHAETATERCIGCGMCAERCPRQAIRMVARKRGNPGPSIMVPELDLSLCIGCGACEYICPATPLKAIWVNGIV